LLEKNAAPKVVVMAIVVVINIAKAPKYLP
jgi:hypothetical protein